MSRVAVLQAFFSRHPVLRQELLAKYPDVTFKEDDRILEGRDLIDFLRGHDKVIMSIDKLSEDVIAALPELKVVAKHGVGMDSIDIKAMHKHGVELGWRGGVNKRTVAEMAINYMILLLRHFPEANRDLRDGSWMRQRGHTLSDSTVGILGCGHIGKDLAGLLAPFGCDILAHDIRDHSEFYAASGVQPVGLDELLARADVLSVHLPLTCETRNILSRERMAQMKPTAVLINTARGGLIDEAALLDLLNAGHFAGAAIDAFLTEPTDNRELVDHPRFWCTPHMGGLSEEAVLAMGRSAIAGLDDHRLPDCDWPPDVWED